MPKPTESARADRELEHAFVVRLWREAGSPQAAAVRGSVLDLRSGRRFYFTELGDLKDFLRLTLEQS